MAIILLLSCNNTVSIPPYFPQENKKAFDTISREQILLGKMLFEDKRLSIDSSTSCASCHRASLAFTDGKMLSQGLPGHFSKHNASTLLNIGFSPTLMFDLRAKHLENQVLIPLNDSNEMNIGLTQLTKRLENDIILQSLSLKAYKSPLTDYVLTRAIAAFERSLLTYSSKFDSFLTTKDTSIFTIEERRGYTLFLTKGTCITCHPSPLFTDFKHYDIGIEPRGSKDLGLMLGTLDSAQIYRFKTPTLRNIAITGPYFHNGMAINLTQAIQIHTNKINNAKDIDKIALSTQETYDIILFLHTLTDKKYLTKK